MSPEDKEEFKSLIKEVLDEQNEIISPTVDVTWVYKHAEVESEDPIIAKAQEQALEVIKVTRTIKWSQILEIIEPSKLNRESVDNVKNLQKLIMYNGDVIFCVVKDLIKFKEDWHTAMKTYDLI